MFVFSVQSWIEKKNELAFVFLFADAFHWPWFRFYILHIVKTRPFGHPSPSHRNSFFRTVRSLFFAVLPFCCLFICRLFLLTLCVSVEFSAANSQIIRYAVNFNCCEPIDIHKKCEHQVRITYFLFVRFSSGRRTICIKKKKYEDNSPTTDSKCRSWQKYLMLFSMWLTDGVVVFFLSQRRWWRRTALANSSSLLSLETSQVFNWKSIRFRCRNDSQRSLFQFWISCFFFSFDGSCNHYIAITIERYSTHELCIEKSSEIAQ